MRASLLSRIALAAALLTAPGAASAADYESWLAAPNAMRWQSDNPWKVNLAVGFGIGPTYEYARDTDVRVLPLIDVEWRGTFFASTQRGIGYNWIRSSSTVAGPRITFDLGRAHGDDEFLANTDDVKSTPEIGFFWTRYVGSLRLNADFKYATSSHKGVHGAVGFANGGRLSPNTTVFAGVEVHYGSKKYNFAYYEQGDHAINDVTPYLMMVRDLSNGMYITLDGHVSAVVGAAGKSDLNASTSYSAGAMFGKRF